MKTLNYYIETMQKERPEPSHKYFAYHMKNLFLDNKIVTKAAEIIKAYGGKDIHGEMHYLGKYQGNIIVFKASPSSLYYIKDGLFTYDPMITVKDYYNEFQ